MLSNLAQGRRGKWEMTALRGIDLKRACLVPSSVFTSPAEVVACERLSVAHKLAVLRRWEFDARRVAGFMGGGGEASSMLHQVQQALQALSERAAPVDGAAWAVDPAGALTASNDAAGTGAVAAIAPPRLLPVAVSR